MVIIQFIYELCGLLLLTFLALTFIAVVWNLFASAIFFAVGLIVFTIRRILEWRYGDLWKNSLRKLLTEDENENQ